MICTNQKVLANEHGLCQVEVPNESSYRVVWLHKENSSGTFHRPISNKQRFDLTYYFKAEVGNWETWPSQAQESAGNVAVPKPVVFEDEVWIRYWTCQDCPDKSKLYQEVAAEAVCESKPLGVLIRVSAKIVYMTSSYSFWMLIRMRNAFYWDYPTHDICQSLLDRWN